MRDMVTALLANNPLLAGPVIALVLFAAIFAAIALRVWRRGKGAYDAAALLPLEDGHD